MTCIVGYTENGVTWMGADSLGVAGHVITKRKDVKIFKKDINEIDKAIVGFTSSFRMGQLIMYDEDLFKIENSLGKSLVHKDVVTKIVPRLISLYENGGYLQKETYGDFIGGDFILASKGNLFEVSSDFQVVESIDNMLSVGCGNEFALGALHVLKDDDMPAPNKVLAALKAAEKFSSGVGRPFYIMNTENDEVMEIT